MSISAVDCIQPAIQHTREQLFTRFRWGQWCRLALVGILAGELHTGSCNFGNLPQILSQSQQRQEEFLAPAFPHIDPARLAQFAGLIVAVLLLGLVLFFVFLYINSVFRFILFESVIRRECSIAEGWNRWHATGRRYFLWQLVFIISTWIFMGLLIGIPVMFMGGAGWFKNVSLHAGGMIGSLILVFGLLLVCVLVAAIVQVLSKDFLVPIMAIEGLDFADGWSRLFAFLRPELGKYAFYVFMRFILSIVAAIIFGIASIIPVLIVGVPSALLVLIVIWSGAGWNPATISLTIIFGMMAFLVLILLVALVCVPGTIFFPAYALYFFAARYPSLAELLRPAPPAPTTPAIEPPLPESPPPQSPTLPPEPEAMG